MYKYKDFLKESQLKFIEQLKLTRITEFNFRQGYFFCR